MYRLGYAISKDISGFLRIKIFCTNNQKSYVHKNVTRII
jgi:hypothetical protein